MSKEPQRQLSKEINVILEIHRENLVHALFFTCIIFKCYKSGMNLCDERGLKMKRRESFLWNYKNLLNMFFFRRK